MSYIIGSLNIQHFTGVGTHDATFFKIQEGIADPWYTGNFDLTYNDIVEGCTALLKQL